MAFIPKSYSPQSHRGRGEKQLNEQTKLKARFLFASRFSSMPVFFSLRVLTKDRTRTGHSQKDRARTGRSQKIAPGLEASNQVRDVKPGPERSEGPAFNHARDVKPGPEHSESPACNMGRNVQREPESSEGSSVTLWWSLANITAPARQTNPPRYTA